MKKLNMVLLPVAGVVLGALVTSWIFMAKDSKTDKPVTESKSWKAESAKMTASVSSSDSLAKAKAVWLADKSNPAKRQAYDDAVAVQMGNVAAPVVVKASTAAPVPAKAVQSRSVSTAPRVDAAAIHAAARPATKLLKVEPKPVVKEEPKPVVKEEPKPEENKGFWSRIFGD